jgi:Predicted signal transduction protein
MTPEEQDGTYLAGLLHDIGYVVMASLMPNEFTTLTRFWEAGERQPQEIEDEIFGVSHPILSAKALKLWKFPKNVQLACTPTTGPFPTTLRPRPSCSSNLRIIWHGCGLSLQPLFSVEIKRQTLPAFLLENDYQPVIQEVALKVEMLVSQAFT